MLRKLLAVLVSGAWLLTSTAASASSVIDAAKGAPVPAQMIATTKNQPPLPPAGPVDIKNAQGQFRDLGFGVILITWLVAGGLLFLIFAGEDDDDNGAPTGTFP